MCKSVRVCERGNVCLPFKVANFSCNIVIIITYVGMPIFRYRKQNYITPYESHKHTDTATDRHTFNVYDFNFFSYLKQLTATTTTTTMHTHFYLWHNQPFNGEKSKQIHLHSHTHTHTASSHCQKWAQIKRLFVRFKRRSRLTDKHTRTCINRVRHTHNNRTHFSKCSIRDFRDHFFPFHFAYSESEKKMCIQWRNIWKEH